MVRTSSFANSEQGESEEVARSLIWQAYEVTQNEGLKKQLHDVLEGLGEAPIQAFKYESMEVRKWGGWALAMTDDG